ncbi:ATP-binding protein [Nostoc punctiforme FACHB-252]|uniref:ATP-binding protein n=1 Tax=Nostoc punctiforme FACHB-252 TaxID=1357509 RepID=A0ABR8HKZ4_NOSPU|nr:ATP-binding protein [Nostoc punctiforme]MBD2616556.1 ATP-binding protein [Nostoc punctiforme FACHB-252]
MDFTAEPELQSSLSSSACFREQELSSGHLSQEVFSITESFRLALVVVNDLVFAKRGKYLSEIEMLVIRGALNDQEYEDIAGHSTYSLNYIQRTVAPRLWDILSETIGDGERVGKKKLWYFLEQVNKKYHIQSVSNEKQRLNVNNLTLTIRGKLPDISRFYGRTQELSSLKELISNQRCISLIGIAGIGKSALVAKLLEEVSGRKQPTFDTLIWKTITHVPLLQDLVAELIELTQSCDPDLSLPEYTQALISVLIKRLQSRRCLLVLDGFDFLFQKSNFQQRLEYGVFFHRLIEEEHKGCILLTGRAWPDELDNIITAKLPLHILKIQGLDIDAAIQLLSTKGLSDKEKCNQLIQTYRGNPSELEAVANRINHFFAGNAKLFFENPTTLVSSNFEVMLNQLFGESLSSTQRQILIYIAERIVGNQQFISFTKLLSGIKEKSQEGVSTLELIKALEKLERQSLIESIKDPVTKEISFTLQPVIKKYIKTDPQGLVHTSDNSKLPFAS